MFNLLLATGCIILSFFAAISLSSHPLIALINGSLVGVGAYFIFFSFARS